MEKEKSKLKISNVLEIGKEEIWKTNESYQKYQKSEEVAFQLKRTFALFQTELLRF